ncbi:hypothetical protein [Rhizobium sp. BK176]|uniref:hypothetical protein n=1 Tax=Rhizobium sp. BK176 TaxID=2587071 RepID=UPI0021679C76|nr:hypothetical protein [Rhizobium sp. BK176]MCS4089322.1 hypothetical protein [Rhizobium sp. BK176]
MLIKVQFLNHYEGKTKNQPRNMERMAWADTEVDIDCIPAGELELVFLEGRGDRETLDFDRAYAFDGKYWAVAEAANNTHFHSMRHTYLPSERCKPVANGLTNFGQEGQRSFSWRAFEYKLMPRQPKKGFRVAEPFNFRNYRPFGRSTWDDIETIEPRANAYYRDNLLIAGDTVYCRIEPPCLAEPLMFEFMNDRHEQRIFTPYGGFGDPIVDFETTYAAACAVDSPGELRHARKERPPFFNPIEDHQHDPVRRGVRALFLRVFGLRPWLAPAAKNPKAAAAVDALYTLWQKSMPYLSDEALDEAAEIMMGVAKDDAMRALLEKWLDRPVCL